HKQLHHPIPGENYFLVCMKADDPHGMESNLLKECSNMPTVFPTHKASIQTQDLKATEEGAKNVKEPKFPDAGHDIDSPKGHAHCQNRPDQNVPANRYLPLQKIFLLDPFSRSQIPGCKECHGKAERPYF